MKWLNSTDVTNTMKNISQKTGLCDSSITILYLLIFSFPFALVQLRLMYEKIEEDLLETSLGAFQLLIVA